MHCETHARAAKVAEAMGQQTAASIKAAAASPSGASQTYKPPSPSQPMMPQSNVPVGKELAKQ